jgi:hypothetical protein
MPSEWVDRAKEILERAGAADISSTGEVHSERETARSFAELQGAADISSTGEVRYPAGPRGRDWGYYPSTGWVSNFSAY